MPDTEVKWFVSKVDWWLGLIIVALPVIEFGGLAAAVANRDSDAVAGMAVGCAMVVAIYGLLLIPIRYGITQDSLIVRFGVVRQEIPLHAIREVYPTHNPLSAPALSLDRLAVRLGGGLLAVSLISPRERDEFLTELAQAGYFVREGDRLLRQS